MRAIALVAALLLALHTGGAVGLDLPDWSKELARGWCMGYADAVESSHRNRNRWRGLIGAPDMTHDEVIAWIYSRPWKDSKTSHTSPRTIGQPAGVAMVGPPPIDAVDLYVVLPRKQFEVATWGVFNGVAIICPSGELAR